MASATNNKELLPSEIRKHVELPEKINVTISGDNVCKNTAMDLILMTDSRLYLRRTFSNEERIKFLTALGVRHTVKPYPEAIKAKAEGYLRKPDDEFIDIPKEEIANLMVKSGFPTKLDTIDALATVQLVPSKYAHHAYGWCTPDGVISGEFQTSARPTDILRELKFIAKSFTTLNMRCQISGINGPELEFIVNHGNVTTEFPTDVLTLTSLFSWFPRGGTNHRYLVTPEQIDSHCSNDTISAGTHSPLTATHVQVL